MKYQDYIGVFDSGVGGISVLKELYRLLPGENYLFYGDSANAPYGEKTVEEVRRLTFRAVDSLAGYGVKAVVIACNTATSAAVISLREKYENRFPVIGVEPALKPAAEAKKHDRILVMATPVTLNLEKYSRLKERFSGVSEIISLPCPGLAERIEQGHLDAPDLRRMLEGFLGPYAGKVDSVVLGCTHYPFVREQIRDILGGIPSFDGGEGTARETRRRLEASGRLSPGNAGGRIVFSSSRDTAGELELYRELFRTPC